MAMTPLFPWDFHATTGSSMEPRGFQSCVIFIGLGDEYPEGLGPDTETYEIRIDPACDEEASTKEVGRLQREWGDVLRLPVEGPHSQDHPYLVAARRMRVRWIGNARLFPSVYDLTIAASFHADGNTYTLAARPSPTAPYRLLHDREYPHPLSPGLPDPRTMSPPDRARLLSILLGVIHLAKEMRRSGHLEGTVRIYKNLYSTFSAATSPVVLAVSYFGLHYGGDGNTQDKLDRSAEFRRALAECLIGQVRYYIEQTATDSPEACAEYLWRRYRPN